MPQLENSRIVEISPLVSPRELKASLPLPETSQATVLSSREAIRALVHGRDTKRLMVVVGPCSIHDPEAAYEYAERLRRVAEATRDNLFIVMRTYFEKPRTVVGWKGLISDPRLDGSCHIPEGLALARSVLLRIGAMGLPCGTEFLDPIVPQYVSDLVSWAAIGARTTESQTHRQMASGLSMPVGFKNGTDASLQTAIDALQSAMTPHSFLGIDQDGFTSIVRTTGNPDGHIVLRGGRLRTNYDAESIRDAAAHLEKAGLPPILMVDCSHANSAKQHARQEEVWRSLIEQRRAATPSLIGVMLESNLVEGNQPIPQKLADLRYGVSVTDACLGWDVTERILRWGHQTLSAG